VGQFEEHVPAVPKAAIDFEAFTAPLKPRPFKTHPALLAKKGSIREDAAQLRKRSLENRGFGLRLGPAGLVSQLIDGR
jgi:hypothetical protein